MFGVDGNMVHVAQLIEGILGGKQHDYTSYGANAQFIAQLFD